MFGFASFPSAPYSALAHLRGDCESAGLRRRAAAVSINQRPPKPATCRAQQSMVAWWVAPLRARQPDQSTPDWQVRCLQARGALSPQPCAHGCTLGIGNAPPRIHRRVHAPVRSQHARAPRTRRARRTSSSDSRKASGRDPPPRRAAHGERRAGEFELNRGGSRHRPRIRYWLLVGCG